MPPVYLPKGSIMLWNGTAVSEHNRAPLSVDVERIEQSQRMANGSMRKYVIADKRTFSTSWEMLPNKTVNTVDGKWGGEDIENFYNTTPGSFTLSIVTTGTTQTFTVMFTEFSKTINKRGKFDMWDVDITLEEV